MNNYYVIEIQTHADGTSGIINTGFPDKLTSEDAFHTAITFANDSTVHCHTVMWITKEGQHVEPPKCYHHAEEIPDAQSEVTV